MDAQRRSPARSSRVMKAAVLFDLLGPYHWARLNAAGAGGELHVLELFGRNVEYPWAPVAGARTFEHHHLFAAGSRQSVPVAQARREIEQVLERVAPGVVFLPGWSDYWALTALAWCLRRRVPAVVMSESTARDEVRRGWKEAIKGRIVRLCAAGLVGGQPHRRYLHALGMPEERIFTGYDVVDNAHFECRAGEVQAPVPERYFLASSRFVPKKNILRLLEAYASYQKRAGVQAWKLVLLGGGVLAPRIAERCAQLGICEHVSTPGFRQYDDLPGYYAGAKVFVHASSSEQWGLVVNEAMAAGLPVLISERCGCVEDLVEEGRNGHRFDPEDVPALARLLWAMTEPSTDLAAMGRESRRIIADWSPQTFQRSFWRAAECARAIQARNASLWDRGLLRVLMSRQ
jgi:1,2-diacylglycerol 3-alpha-glucosyltransferase